MEKRRRLVNSDIFLDVFQTQNEYDFFYFVFASSQGIDRGDFKSSVYYVGNHCFN